MTKSDSFRHEVPSFLSLPVRSFAQLQVYIELKSIEIRTETDTAVGDDADAVEELWNQEPLDHTRHQGAGRADYGCPFSSEDGPSFEVCLPRLCVCVERNCYTK